MNTMLEVSGPFQIPFRRVGLQKRIDNEHVTEFWNQKELSKLKLKQGTYIFALRVAKGSLPWYVGQASKTFQQECFTTHKTEKYNKLLFETRKGTPVMYFVALPGNRQKISKPVLSHLEKTLIQMASLKNGGLLNIQGKALPEWGIKGVIRGGKGKATSSATTFKKMMGF